jgi:hypothetical protein
MPLRASRRPVPLQDGRFPVLFSSKVSPPRDEAMVSSGNPLAGLQRLRIEFRTSEAAADNTSNHTMFLMRVVRSGSIVFSARFTPRGKVVPISTRRTKAVQRHEVLPHTTGEVAVALGSR